MSNSNRPRTVLDQPGPVGGDNTPAAPPWASPRPQAPASLPPSGAPFGAPPSFGGGGRAATELEPAGSYGNPPAPGFAQPSATPAPAPAIAGRASTVWVPPEPSTPSAGSAGAPGAAPAPAAAKAPARKITGWLVSADRLQAYTLHEGANRIGRGLENEIVLDNPTISSFQCNLFCREQGVHLMPDPRLTNPIEVNGEPIFSTTQLHGPTRVKMGNSEWTIVLLPEA